MKIKRSKTFYCPKHTIDKDTGWVFPQCREFLKGMNSYVDTPRGIYHVQRLIGSGFIFPRTKPLLGGIELMKSAKPTDFLSTSMFDKPLLSKKAVDCLRPLNFGTHRIYPVRVYHRLKPILYFFAGVLPYKQADYIIWDKCRFYDTELAFKSSDLDSIYDKRLDTEVPVFRSVDDFDAFSATHWPEVESIAVNEKFPIELDYVKFYNAFVNKLVSERFVETAKANGLIGLDFKQKIEIVQYI